MITRTIAPGDLFVALKDVRDWHDFVVMGRLRQRGRGCIWLLHVPDGFAERCGRWLVVDGCAQGAWRRLA